MLSSLFFFMGTFCWAQDGNISCKGNLLARSGDFLGAVEATLELSVKGETFTFNLLSNGDTESASGRGNLRGAEIVPFEIVNLEKKKWQSSFQYIEGNDKNFLLFKTQRKDEELGMLYVEGLFACNGL